MSILALKRRRDIWRQKWQYLAVGVAVVLGVALFAGTFDAYLNLGSSLDRTYERLRMADVTVVGADDGFAEEVDAIDGVATVMERRRAELPFEIGEFSFVGRVIAMPVGEDPPLNRIDIDEGSGLDDDPSGVVLETHAARDFDVGIGDTISIAGQEVTVVGIATSPEYLWPARDRQNIFTPPKSFAVVFGNEAILEQADSAAVIEQVLVQYADGVDVEAVDAEVERSAEAASATDIELLVDHPSNATIHLEIDALRTIAIALPVLFLAAAGMAIYVVVTRLVFSQRSVIGTLRATGFSQRDMSRHFLFYGLGIGLVGAVVGALLGLLMAWGMTAIYTAIFGIPDLVANIHPPTIVVALLFGAVAGTIAGVPPARTVARLAPAEAMRGDTPAPGGRLSLFERLVPPLRRAPVRWRMSLRGLGRNKKRSTSLVVGVVLGMTLILGSWGMLDTMVTGINRQFNEVAVEDATVVFSVPVGDEQLEAVGAAAGVAHVEPVVGQPVTLVYDNERYTTTLEAYQAGTRVHGFEPPLPSRGVLLGNATEDLLDVGVGDVVDLELSAFDVEVSVEVAGFVDEPLATMAYMDIAALTSLLAEAEPSIGADVLSQPTLTSAKVLLDTDPEVAIRGIRDVESVAAVVDSNEIRELIDSFQVFFYVFIIMMLLFGGAMAFALIFNIISVNVAERSPEFASMRANGLTHRRVASLILGETFLLTAIGIVPGLVAGYLAAVAFMNSFSSDQFPITADMRWFTFVGAAVAMFVVAGLSLIPAIRAVKKINVGQIVRERAA